MKESVKGMCCVCGAVVSWLEEELEICERWLCLEVEVEVVGEEGEEEVIIGM